MCHLYSLTNRAEFFDNTTRRASAQAKLRYSGRIRGVWSTAKQYVTVEKVPGKDMGEVGAVMRKKIREHEKSIAKQEFMSKRIVTVQKAERTFHLRARCHRK